MIIMSDNLNAASVLEKIKDFPPMPQTAIQVIKILKNPDYHITDLTLCISKDISLTAEVLKMANSGLYSPPNPITTLKQAITYLGMSQVKNLVISLSSKTLYGAGQVRLLDQKLWEHSLMTAICSRLCSIRFMKKYAEESFILGLMHDIGQLIMSKNVDEFEDIVRNAYNKNLNVYQLEQETLGFNHTEVGSLAMKKWEMPEIFYNVVKFHHNPDESPAKDLTHLISFSNNLCNYAGFGITEYYDEENLNKSQEYLEISNEVRDEIQNTLLDIFEKEKELFKI